MATTWKAPTWRMPNEKNQSKFESYSLDFDGNNDYITIESSTELNNVPSNPYSFSFWFKQPSHTGSKVLSEKRVANTFLNAQYTIHSENGSIAWYGGAGANTATYTSSALSFDQWHHIVCVAESATVGKIYVDGELNTTSSNNRINSAVVAGQLIIGANYQANIDFIGQLSQYCIFDYALSESQVSSLYNSGSPINPITLKPAPIAYYPLGGNASTGGDSTNTLSVPNVAVPDASVFDFSGSNDFINCGNSSVFDITSAITVSAWIKAGSSGWVASFPFFVTKGSNVSYMLFGRKVSSTSLLPRLRIGVNGDPNMVEATTSVSSTGWHHILGTFDGSTMKIYVNGQLDNSKSLSQSIPTGSDDLTIGGVSGGGTSGLISNVQIWNTELIASEVSTLYNSGVPLLTGTQPQASNLKAWYKLDQLNSYWDIAETGNWTISNEAIN